LHPQEVLRLQEEWQSRSLDLDKAKQDLEEQRGRLAADRKAVLWNRNCNLLKSRNRNRD
jgi:hypothetical protein